MNLIQRFFQLLMSTFLGTSIIVLTILLFSPFPDFPDLLIADPLFNSTHIIIGAVLYVLAYVYWYDRLAIGVSIKSQYFVGLAILFISIGFAGAFEIVQPFFGRSRSLEDCALSSLGSFLSYLLLSHEGRCKYKLLGINAFLIFCMSIYPIFMGISYSQERRALFPVLLSSHSSLLKLVNPIWGAEVSRDVEGCALTLHALDQYSGIEIPLGFQDWTEYTKLKLVFSNLDQDGGVVGVRVDDKKKISEFTERFNAKMIISQDSTRAEFDIAHLKNIQNFNPKWIRRLLIYNNSSIHELHLCLKEVKLIK